MTVCSGRILLDSALRGVPRRGGGGATTAGTGTMRSPARTRSETGGAGEGAAVSARPRKVDVVAESDDKPCPQICPELPIPTELREPHSTSQHRIRLTAAVFEELRIRARRFDSSRGHRWNRLLTPRHAKRDLRPDARRQPWHYRDLDGTAPLARSGSCAQN